MGRWGWRVGLPWPWPRISVASGPGGPRALNLLVFASPSPSALCQRESPCIPHHWAATMSWAPSERRNRSVPGPGRAARGYSAFVSSPEAPLLPPSVLR